MSDLHEIAGTQNQKRVADVIFLHGIGGDAYKTWGAKNDKDTNFWLAWLATDYPQLGIWSLGYNAAVSQWLGGQIPRTELATQILGLLEIQEIGERPIIFVAHSLGGLIVKQILCNIDTNVVSGYGRFADQVKGIYFIATPHSGAGIATFGSKLPLFFPTLNLKELARNDADLRQLNTWFRNWDSDLHVQIEILYEGEAIAGTRIVDEASADPGIPHVNSFKVQKNHTAIVSEVSRTGEDAYVYSRVKLFLRNITRSLPNP